MAKQVEDEVVYYYDSHSTEEDLMGETSFHADLIRYLMDLLRWLFREQQCAVYENLNFYQTSNFKEFPLAPDIAVIKGVGFRPMKSWRIGKTGPAPQMVFEIASEETWKKDREEKPMQYALMGVEEYFAYDPNDPPILRNTSQRLFGWQLDKDKREMRKMRPGPGGSLWSAHLDSFLVPEGEYLRLYDRDGHLRLTKAEAEEMARIAETQRADAEAKKAEAERRRADTEAMARRAEAERAEALAKKLRSLGIDPERI